MWPWVDIRIYGPEANSQTGAPKLHTEVVEGHPLALLHTIFALFWKTYDLLQSIYGSRVVHKLFKKTLEKIKCEILKGELYIISEKGARGDRLVRLLLDVMQTSVRVSCTQYDMSSTPLEISAPFLQIGK